MAKPASPPINFHAGDQNQNTERAEPRGDGGVNAPVQTRGGVQTFRLSLPWIFHLRHAIHPAALDKPEQRVTEVAFLVCQELSGAERGEEEQLTR